MSVLFPNSAPGLAESRMRAADDSRDWREIASGVVVVGGVLVVLLALAAVPVWMVLASRGVL